MPIRAPRKTKSTSLKLAELAVAVPQVMGHRLTRMALAGPVPSARDRKEFNRMVSEKNHAFQEACQAMLAQSVRAQQALASNLLWSMWAPSAASAASQMQLATLGILGKGLGPVHRTAVANARRLARTRLR